MSSASSTCSSQNSSCLRGASAAVVVKTSQLQAWSARQAKSQSPVIMQSVKSTQVQKPILQTAIAPTAPPVNPSPLTFITSNATSSVNSSTTINNYNNSATSSSSPLKMISTSSSVSSVTSIASSGVSQSAILANQTPAHSSHNSTSTLSGSSSHNNNKDGNNSANHFTASSAASYTGYPVSTSNSSVSLGLDSAKLFTSSSSSSIIQSQSHPTTMPPPPYKPSLESSTNISSLQLPATNMPVSSPNCSGIPPPPYISIVQQSSKQSSINTSLLNVSLLNSPNSTLSSYRLEEAPPPPPPPPYAASFPATVSKESDVVPATPSFTLSDYPPRLNNNLTATSVSVPTTDPPSYASSVAALAAKRVVSSVPVSTVVTSESSCNIRPAKSIKQIGPFNQEKK